MATIPTSRRSEINRRRILAGRAPLDFDALAAGRDEIGDSEAYVVKVEKWTDRFRAVISLEDEVIDVLPGANEAICWRAVAEFFVEAANHQHFR